MSSLHPHHGLDHTLRALLEILIVAIFIATFIVQPFRVPSQSMEPSLHLGDFVIADQQSFAPEGPLHALLPRTTIHRGDLAVFHFPPDPSTFLVKRILGLPGDRLHMRDGVLILNGTPLPEPYAYFSPTRLDPYRDDFPFLRSIDPNVYPQWWGQLRRSVQQGELVVPPDSYFVLGDNRNNSEDSRYWGFVPRSALTGRPLLVYLSLPTGDKGHLRLHSLLHGFRVVR